jgi:hypothetical protein
VTQLVHLRPIGVIEMLAGAKDLHGVKAGSSNSLKPYSGKPVIRKEVSRKNFFHAMRSIGSERWQVAYRIVPSPVDSVV